MVDPLCHKYRRMAERFIRYSEAGHDAAAWALFLGYRKGYGTWNGMAEPPMGSVPTFRTQ